MFANAELRFPLIEAALTPIGVVGGVRGVFFAGIGGAWFSNSPATNPCTGESSSFKFATNNPALCQVPTGYKTDVLGNPVIVTNPQTGQQTFVLNYAAAGVSGFRLQDGRASYGLGLETFALGFPIHFDWSWRTLMNHSLGRRGVRLHERRRRRKVHQLGERLPQAALRGLDRLRLLDKKKPPR